MTITDRIEINPKVMMGKPVIRGTRIPVELILRKLSEGASEDELLDAYPGLPSRGLTGAVVFYDGQMYNPPRLVLAFLRSAVGAGPCRSTRSTLGGTSS